MKQKQRQNNVRAAAGMHCIAAKVHSLTSSAQNQTNETKKQNGKKNIVNVTTISKYVRYKEPRARAMQRDKPCRAKLRHAKSSQFNVLLYTCM